MPFLSGKGSDMKDDLDFISSRTREKFNHIKNAHHVWIDSIQENDLKNALDRVRKNKGITNSIHAKFPGAAVFAVKESDELYWAVSPKEAGGSDRALVDCHYDAPFALLPTGGVVYYRIILACNENNEVSTVFPTENASVKMTTGDYHGLDYNKDWHCVEGSIPPGKYRILLKLHYLIVPEGSERWSSWVRWINVTWTKLSRDTMRMSAEPKNLFEYFIAGLVNMSRYIFNNFYMILLFIVSCILILFFYNKRIYYKRRTARYKTQDHGLKFYI